MGIIDNDSGALSLEIIQWIMVKLVIEYEVIHPHME